MKNAMRMGFFLVFFLVFLLVGMTSLIRASVKREHWDPAEGAAAGDKWINNYLPGRQNMLIPYQIWNAAIDKRLYSENNAYIAPNGQTLPTSSAPGYRLPTDQLMQLASWCGEHGINFLYVILPGKPETDTELTELGISCERNLAADQMAEELTRQKIPVMDLRDSFREEDYYSFFYKTEHHWTADAGIKAARDLVNRLNADFGMSLEAKRLSEENIGRTVYPGVFVGEQGMKMLGKYGERDDFIVRFPLYEPHLRYICPEDETDISGGFDILTNEKILSEDHLNGGRSLYYYYLLKNSNFVEIWDEDVNSGDIFLIKDSFSNVLTPFLALTAKHVTAWDMRGDNHVYAYLEAHPEIETVIIAYSYSFITKKNMNDFQ